jgi:glucose-6-phosphate 1-dehydrogenase
MALNDFDLILFGGGGDLAMRKLLPALYARDCAKDLPEQARLICVGRQAWSTQQFVSAVNTTAKLHVHPHALQPDAWEKFCARIHYVSLDATE